MVVRYLLILIFIASTCFADPIHKMFMSIARKNAAVVNTVSYESYSSTEVSSNTDIIGTLPSGTVSGNMLIAFHTLDAQSTVTLPIGGGWTKIDEDDAGNQVESFSYYLEYSSGGPWTWVSSATTDQAMHIVRLSKTGGSWVAPDTAGYHSIAVTGESLYTITTSSVTGIANCVLLTGFGHDNGGVTVNSPPADMTITNLLNSNGVSQVTYYEQRNAGAVTKSITYDDNDFLTGMAIIVGITE